SGALADPIYVHAKIAIVDDAWLTLGSANLNEHSFFNDSEMNVVTHEAALARETRLRLWAEHLELPQDELLGDPTGVIDRRWRPIAAEQLQRRRARAPLTHRLVELPACRDMRSVSSARSRGSSSTASRLRSSGGPSPSTAPRPER